MARLTHDAELQVSALIRHFDRLGRTEAIEALLRSVTEAARLADTPQTRLRPYPSNYAGLADLGFGWFRRGRHWFACRTNASETWITNVVFDAANIPGRVAPR